MPVKRPIRVTVIAWLLIASGILAVFAIPITLLMPLLDRNLPSIPITSIAMSVVNSIVDLVSGIAMLKRLKWSRWLYLITNPSFTVVNNVLSWQRYGSFEIIGLIFWGIFYIVILLLLLSPPSSAYFNRTEMSATNAQVVSPGGNDNVIKVPPQKSGRIIKQIIAVLAFGISVIIIGGIVISFFLILGMLGFSGLGVLIVWELYTYVT
jgi:hypothetical protein